MKTISKLFFLAMIVASFAACKEDDPVHEHGEELITDVVITMTPSFGLPTTLTFSDPDGDGGNVPVIEGGTLYSQVNYTVDIELSNTSEDPAEDITHEIEHEAEEHQFFFSTSDGLNLEIDYADQDANGNPVGLSCTAIGLTSTGDLTVVLRHEPDKGADGVAGGDITNAGGETDIEIVFPITIE